MSAGRSGLDNPAARDRLRPFMDEVLHKLDWVLPLRNELFTPVFELLSALGHTLFFFFLIPILYWAWDKRATNRVMIVLLLSALLNLYLKDLFQDPRPEAYFMEGQKPESFGLPSGHTQLAIVFWGALAIEIGKRWFWIMASVLAAGISFSRLYLGVHDLEDVIGGAFIGFVSLPAYWTLLRVRDRVVHPQIAGPAALALGVMALFFWPHQSPLPDAAVMISGFLLGWLTGVFFERKSCRFETKSKARKTVLAVILGLAGVAGLAAVLGFGLRKLVDAGLLPDTLAIAFGSCAVALFMALVAPCLLVKAALMGKTAPQDGR